MRRWLLLCVAALAACATDPGASPAGKDPLPDIHGVFTSEQVPPGECVQNISLYGMGGSQPTRVPVSVDTAGVTLCLALDGRDNLQVAHFAANMPYEMGDTSSFAMSLYDVDGVLIVDGWDVAFGTSPTTVFTNLEAGMPKGQVTYARLVIASRGGEMASQVALYLFEPYE